MIFIITDGAFEMDFTLLSTVIGVLWLAVKLLFRNCWFYELSIIDKGFYSKFYSKLEIVNVLHGFEQYSEF